MVKSIISMLAAFAVVTSGGCGRLFGNGEWMHLKTAEELSRMKQYDDAIAEYRRHMEYRLSIKDRAEWENPYFYLILIGDLQLKQSRPDEALATYNEAEQKGVDENLISDRYRSLAHWYENQGDLERAVAILKERREKDPILIDSMLDRLSKEIVAKEDEAASAATAGKKKKAAR